MAVFLCIIGNAYNAHYPDPASRTALSLADFIETLPEKLDAPFPDNEQEVSEYFCSLINAQKEETARAEPTAGKRVLRTAVAFTTAGLLGTAAYLGHKAIKNRADSATNPASHLQSWTSAITERPAYVHEGSWTNRPGNSGDENPPPPATPKTR